MTVESAVFSNPGMSLTRIVVRDVGSSVSSRVTVVPSSLRNDALIGAGTALGLPIANSRSKNGPVAPSAR